MFKVFCLIAFTLSSVAVAGPWGKLNEQCVAQASDSHEALLVVCADKAALFSDSCKSLKAVKIDKTTHTIKSPKHLDKGSWEFDNETHNLLGGMKLTSTVVFECEGEKIFFVGEYDGPSKTR